MTRDADIMKRDEHDQETAAGRVGSIRNINGNRDTKNATADQVEIYERKNTAVNLTPRIRSGRFYAIIKTVSTISETVKTIIGGANGARWRDKTRQNKSQNIQNIQNSLII